MAGDAARTTLVGALQLSKAVDHDVTVWVVSESGSAVEGQDYEPVLVPVTIRAGETTATLEFSIVGDGVREDDEFSPSHWRMHREPPSGPTTP